MAVNARFSTGLELLTLLALAPEKAHPSQTLAASMETNAVVVRRLLVTLHAAKLVTSVKGPSGGSKLSRSPRQITLGDIYRALEPGEIFHAGSTKTAKNKPLSEAMQTVFRKSRRALEKELDSVKLHQFAKKVGKKSAKAEEKKAAPKLPANAVKA